MNLVILESKYAAEARNQVWDFTSRLAFGETITSATASSAVYSGATAAAKKAAKPAGAKPAPAKKKPY